MFPKLLSFFFERFCNGNGSFVLLDGFEFRRLHAFALLLSMDEVGEGVLVPSPHTSSLVGMATM